MYLLLKTEISHRVAKSGSLSVEFCSHSTVAKSFTFPSEQENRQRDLTMQIKLGNQKVESLKVRIFC